MHNFPQKKFFAQKNKGSFLNGKKIFTRNKKKLVDSVGLTNSWFELDSFVNLQKILKNIQSIWLCPKHKCFVRNTSALSAQVLRVWVLVDFGPDCSDLNMLQHFFLLKMGMFEACPSKSADSMSTGWLHFWLKLFRHMSAQFVKVVDFTPDWSDLNKRQHFFM